MKVSCFAIIFILFSSIFAEEISIVSWNVESSGANTYNVAQRIASFEGYDIWGLTEVEGESAAQVFEEAAEEGENADFAYILGSTGGDKRLLILYKENRFELLESFELHDINIRQLVRSPLVARFEDKKTSKQFFFMVNHLYRTRWYYRHKQARLLNEWASYQTIPVIAVGDYNFDWDVHEGETKHDKGYDYLTENDVFKWMRPSEYTQTQSSDFFNSILDFIFTTFNTDKQSEIIVEPGDFPDDSTTSDHRPVVATLSIID